MANFIGASASNQVVDDDVFSLTSGESDCVHSHANTSVLEFPADSEFFQENSLLSYTMAGLGTEGQEDDSEADSDLMVVGVIPGTASFRQQWESHAYARAENPAEPSTLAADILSESSYDSDSEIDDVDDDESYSMAGESDSVDFVRSSEPACSTQSWPHPRDACTANAFRRLDNVDQLGMSACVTNAATCSKCYCYICDVPASQCLFWRDTKAAHCHSHSKWDPWVGDRQRLMLFLNGLRNLVHAEGREHLPQAVIDFAVKKMETDGLEKTVDFLLNTNRYTFPRLPNGEKALKHVPWSFMPSLVALLDRKHFCCLLRQLCGLPPLVLTSSPADVYSAQLGQELVNHLPSRIDDTDTILCLVLQTLFYNPCISEWVGLVNWVVRIVTNESWVCHDPSLSPQFPNALKCARSLVDRLHRGDHSVLMKYLKHPSHIREAAPELVRALLVALAATRLYVNCPSMVTACALSFKKAECYWVVWHMAATAELSSSVVFAKCMLKHFMPIGFTQNTALINTVLSQFFQSVEDCRVLLHIIKLLKDKEGTELAPSYTSILRLMQLLALRVAEEHSRKSGGAGNIELLPLLQTIADQDRTSEVAEKFGCTSTLGEDAAFCTCVHVLMSNERYKRDREIMEWFIDEQCAEKVKFCDVREAMRQASDIMEESKTRVVDPSRLYTGYRDHSAVRIMVAVVVLTENFASVDYCHSLVACAQHFKNCSWAVAVLCSLNQVQALPVVDRDLVQMVMYLAIPESGVAVLTNSTIRRWLENLHLNLAVQLLEAILDSSPDGCHNSPAVAHLRPALDHVMVLWQRVIVVLRNGTVIDKEILLSFIKLLTKHGLSNEMQQRLPVETGIRLHIRKLFYQVDLNIDNQQKSPCSLQDMQNLWAEVQNLMEHGEVDEACKRIDVSSMKYICDCPVTDGLYLFCAAQDFILGKVTGFLEGTELLSAAGQGKSVHVVMEKLLPWIVTISLQTSRYDKHLLQLPRHMKECWLAIRQQSIQVMPRLVEHCLDRVLGLFASGQTRRNQREALVQWLRALSEVCEQPSWLCDFFQRHFNRFLDRLRTVPALHSDLQHLTDFVEFTQRWVMRPVQNAAVRHPHLQNTSPIQPALKRNLSMGRYEQQIGIPSEDDDSQGLPERHDAPHAFNGDHTFRRHVHSRGRARGRGRGYGNFWTAQHPYWTDRPGNRRGSYQHPRDEWHRGRRPYRGRW